MRLTRFINSDNRLHSFVKDQYFFDNEELKILINDRELFFYDASLTCAYECFGENLTNLKVNLHVELGCGNNRSLIDNISYFSMDVELIGIKTKMALKKTMFYTKQIEVKLPTGVGIIELLCDNITDEDIEGEVDRIRGLFKED